MIADHSGRASVCLSPLTSVGTPPRPPPGVEGDLDVAALHRTAPGGWAAATARLMASTPAARQSSANSAPDQPAVRAASCARRRGASARPGGAWRWRIASRPARSGTGTAMWASKPATDHGQAAELWCRLPHR